MDIRNVRYKWKKCVIYRATNTRINNYKIKLLNTQHVKQLKNSFVTIFFKPISTTHKYARDFVNFYCLPAFFYVFVKKTYTKKIQVYRYAHIG